MMAAPGRIFATVNGMYTSLPHGGHQLAGGWRERRDEGDTRAVEYVRCDSGAIAAIIAERDRQIAMGYDQDHDDRHAGGELITAPWGAVARTEDALQSGRVGSVEGYKRRLVEAAAQIAAEYDRVVRAAGRVVEDVE